MMASLSASFGRWRSRQFSETFSSPSWNHLKNGAFDSSRICVKGRDHLSSARACFAQKPSKSLSASAHMARYAAMPGTFAFLTNSAGGGKARDSFNTDSMVDIFRAPRVDIDL